MTSTELVIPYISEKTTALTLPDDLPWDQYQAIGKSIQRAGQVYRWLLGDWINFGIKHYADKLEQLEMFAAQDIETSHARKIAEAIPAEMRVPSLTYRHAEAILTEANPERIQYWREYIIKNPMSVPELRKTIRVDQSEINPEDNAKLPSYPGEELIQDTLDFSIKFKQMWNSLDVSTKRKILPLLKQQFNPVLDVLNAEKF